MYVPGPTFPLVSVTGSALMSLLERVVKAILDALEYAYRLGATALPLLCNATTFTVIVPTFRFGRSENDCGRQKPHVVKGHSKVFASVTTSKF
jgi:hypothetical protein